MTSYQNFIGIDMGKDTFVGSVNASNTTSSYNNTSEGFALFIADHASLLPTALCVVETTGGYELSFVYALCHESYAVHRADARKVKYFIRSFKQAAKTDALDARALSLYAEERAKTLDVFQPASHTHLVLFNMVQRRRDLKQMLVAEKNRKQSPSMRYMKDSCDVVIGVLEEQIKAVTQQIAAMVEQDEELRSKHKVLTSIPGVGDIVAYELLVLLPELGALSRRQIASLAGIAPKANDSGKHQGYRRTGYGRQGVKPILFLAAMAARHSKSYLKEFYERLEGRGKKKMVVLVALMRKILVMANARVKEWKEKGEIKLKQHS